jgi:hypothetical protein
MFRQPDHILGSLKEKFRQKIREDIDYLRIYGRMKTLGLTRFNQYYLFFKDELKVSDVKQKNIRDTGISV